MGLPSVAVLEALNYQLQMKPIRSTTLDLTTSPAIAARCCYAPVRLMSIRLNRSENPFLFKIFAGGLNFFYLIIKELGNTFKNISKFIWISQNKCSIFVL